MPARSRYMSVVLPERRARVREGGDSVGTVGRTAPLGGLGWVRGRAFSSFADARPLSPSKPFSQSKC